MLLVVFYQPDKAWYKGRSNRSICYRLLWNIVFGCTKTRASTSDVQFYSEPSYRVVQQPSVKRRAAGHDQLCESLKELTFMVNFAQVSFSFPFLSGYLRHVSRFATVEKQYTNYGKTIKLCTFPMISNVLHDLQVLYNL